MWRATEYIIVALLAGIALPARPGPALPAHFDAAGTAFFRQTNGWEAGDGATSVPLSGGRALWLFGDSFIDQLDPATGTTPCLFDARNAVTVQNAKDPQHPVTLRPTDGGRSFFRPPEAPVGEPWPCFWPGAGFQRGDTIWISLMEIQQTPEGGMWGFRNVREYWGEMNASDLKSVKYIKIPGLNGIPFLSGFVADEAGGCVYGFGNRRRATESDVLVARFPLADPTAPWSFWDGRGWDANATNAAPVTRASSTSVCVCRVNNKFLLFSTEFSVACDQGRRIYLSTSDSPTGPFSPPQTIYTIDDAVSGHHPFFYLANAHPESVNAENELLITYCINGYEPCVPTCVNRRANPDYYRPRAIRLPLPR